MNAKRDSAAFIFIWLSCALLTGFLSLRAADGYPRQPHLDVVHYDFFISLGDDSDRVSGQCLLRFRRVGGEGGLLELDLLAPGSRGGTGMTVSRVRQQNKSIPFTQTQDRLQIRPKWPTGEDEEETIQIDYAGIPADGLIISKTRYGERSFFGDNWPNRARHWLPVVDHPWDKAACRFRVEAPGHYQVVAVGDLVETRDLPHGRRLTVYEEPFPLPTKVMVIGVSRFAVAHLAPLGSVEISSWVYPRDRDRGFASFARVPEIMRFYGDKIGAYAFAKMASVQSKTRYGGMENAGAVFYHEGVFERPSGSESLIAHELAHQWFGDGVSEADWQHIWLSEGFATYLTAVYAGHRQGEGALALEMKAARRRVIAAAQKNPQGKVVDPGLGMDRLLSALSYQKGAWVLHMLRRHLGEARFWAGIREFYRRFVGRSVLTEDLVRCLEESSGQKLDWFFAQWLDRPGFPVIRATMRHDPAGGQTLVRLEQVQPWPKPFVFDLDLEFRFAGNSAPQSHRVSMQQGSEEFAFATAKRPDELLLDPQVRLLFALPGWEESD